MKEITILADDVRIMSAGHNQVSVSMYRPEIELSDYFSDEDIVDNVNNLEDLFEAIIEKDSEILHSYLERAGIIYNKG